MGVGLVPFYDPEVPDAARYNGDGKGLAQEFEVLERIAADAGFPPLSRFTSEALLWDGEFDDPPPPSDLSYHRISDALPTIEGLIGEVRGKPEVAAQLSDPARTLEELAELDRSLRAAAAIGARVCLTFW